jgi:membrane protease YdiL (CAAX protease family)
LAQIVVAGAAGLVLTILYLWRRDLGTNMVAHFLVDGSQLLLP